MSKSLVLTLVISLMAIAGCSTATKQKPHMSYTDVSVQAKIDRQDMVVLEAVEGTSDTTSVLLGLVQIIDGSKVKVLGIPFFTDKYTYFTEPGLFGLFGLLGGGPLDRAYYKALERHPDADVVLVKSYDSEFSGVPLLFSNTATTVRGKAMKIKADQ